MAKRYASGFLGVFVSIALNLVLLYQAEATPPIPIYIFGDSTLDVGTNSLIPECKARADVSFNGIDFPYSEPTGRFSNGLNIADQIVRLMGLRKSPPPFLKLLSEPSTFQQNILQGANFASGGSGVMSDTGKNQYIKVIPLRDQIQQFSTIRSNITHMTGSEEATDGILSKALFLISVGSNDIFEYLLNLTEPLPEYEFTTTFISTYEYHIKTLYELGARTFGVLTVPPIGCTPFARAVFNNNSDCFSPAQDLAIEITVSIAGLLGNFSTQVQDIKYSVGDMFLMTTTLIEDMFAFGFKNIAAACCGNGTYGCNETASFCTNREEYLFWDRFHPTERASEVAALTLFGASSTLIVAPMNFSQLLGVNMQDTNLASSHHFGFNTKNDKLI